MLHGHAVTEVPTTQTPAARFSLDTVVNVYTFVYTFRRADGHQDSEDQAATARRSEFRRSSNWKERKSIFSKERMTPEGVE